MNLKSKSIAIATTVIILFSLAILVWANQTGKINIFGAPVTEIITKTIKIASDWIQGTFSNTVYDEGVGLKLKSSVSGQAGLTHYQLQGANYDQLKSLNVKYLIVDIDDDGSGAQLSEDQIEKLKEDGKVVLSYLSIGEAEEYRSYWQSGWTVGNPEFLDEENSDWPGNYKVKYWYPEWQEIIKGQLDKIVDAGYSGVYLDIIDAYEYYAPGGESGLNRSSAAEDMIAFVANIRNEARVVKGKENFLIVPQNSPELYLDYYDLYKPVVDGFGKEDTWYNEDGQITEVDQTKNLLALDKAVADGKFVLAIDYPTQENNICDFYKKCLLRGFYCTVSNRALDLAKPKYCGGREDGAVKITNSSGNISNQNACFSPDSKYILFTRWQKGYNKGPSELVKINMETSQETMIISADDSDNVNVPFGSWINGKITWASDRGGAKEEIFTANDDGTNIKQVTTHIEEGSYIEPVFNPTNNKEIVFEYAPSEDSVHHLAYVNTETGKVTHLTNNATLDDRLPSWSADGKKILWQRADLGQDNWHIYIADITAGSNPSISNLKDISQGGEGEYDTDNSWAYNDRYVLSSADYFNSLVPHIFAVPAAGGPVKQITNYTLEDGAPSYAPNGSWIAFESHETSAAESPSEIWIIPTPVLE